MAYTTPADVGEPVTDALHGLRRAFGMEPLQNNVKPHEIAQRIHQDLEGYTITKKPKKIWNVIGLLAAVISFVGIAVQIDKIHDRESAEDFSYVFLWGTVAVQVLWVIYGIGNGIKLYAVISFVFLLLAVHMLHLKHIYQEQAEGEEEGV